MVRGNLRASGIDAILEGAGHRIIPCIVYENYDPIVPVVGPFPVSSVFVGSPSAGERLLKANPWMRDAVFVAIGKTTKSALEAMGVGKVLIAGAGRESWLEAITGVYKGTAG
jgi:uroporphyrinogen-III synthase